MEEVLPEPANYPKNFGFSELRSFLSEAVGIINSQEQQEKNIPSLRILLENARRYNPDFTEQELSEIEIFLTGVLSGGMIGQ